MIKVFKGGKGEVVFDGGSVGKSGLAEMFSSSAIVLPAVTVLTSSSDCRDRAHPIDRDLA